MTNKAVDILEERLNSCGAEIIAELLKIDGDVESQLAEAENWGNKMGQILRK